MNFYYIIAIGNIGIPSRSARERAWPVDNEQCSSQHHFSNAFMRPFPPMRNADGLSNMYTGICTVIDHTVSRGVRQKSSQVVAAQGSATEKMHATMDAAKANAALHKVPRPRPHHQSLPQNQW
ncbi:hypothetical protein ANCCAN_21675 [Ancylostoma caninum]|uniref:Uncharacterized protein n=1 Tax=Ancylostoma caninum TaxID=29170 RepID=A0A368FLV0_ANCCA|nr:hypothetical protein ANCCAN_21675 [Ancylostoma caninum]